MGNYFMLPRYPVWGKDEVLLQTPKTNYSLGNLEQLFVDMGVTDGTNCFQYSTLLSIIENFESSYHTPVNFLVCRALENNNTSIEIS